MPIDVVDKRHISLAHRFERVQRASGQDFDAGGWEGQGRPGYANIAGILLYWPRGQLFPPLERYAARD